MQIACTSISAAVDVLRLFLGAGLRPGAAFRVTGPYPPVPPIHFIFSEAPRAELIAQLQTIPDVIIVDTGAA